MIAQAVSDKFILFQFLNGFKKGTRKPLDACQALFLIGHGKNIAVDTFRGLYLFTDPFQARTQADSQRQIRIGRRIRAS